MYFTHYGWVGLIVSLVLVLVFIVLEFRRGGKRIYLRILMTIILGIGLFMLFSRPVFRKEIEKSNLIILTPSYQRATLDSLSAVHPSAIVAQWDTLTIVDDRLDQVFILGSGIPIYDLWKVKGLDVNYIDARDISGYQSIHFPDRVTQDDLVKIAGNYSNMTDDSLKLTIRFRDNVFDSTYLPPKEINRFVLEAIALLPGKYEYILEASQGDSLISSEMIPLEILSPPKYRMLMVNGFPTFESRYLKDHLVGEGHQIVIRNSISKGRYALERHNTSLPGFNRLSQEYLSKFDVLILDLESMNRLNRNDRSELVQSVQNGLNLFLMPEEGLFDYGSQLLPRFITSKEDRAVLKLSTPGVSLKMRPYAAKPAFDLTALWVDDQPVGFKKYRGMGSVNSLYTTTTYPLQLKGDSLAYKRIWNTVFDQVIRPTDSLKVMRDKFPIKDEPFEISFLTRKVPEVSYEQNTIGVRHGFLEGRSSVKLWPSKTGWNNVLIEEERSWFYVYDESQWRSVREVRKRLENIRASDRTDKQFDQVAVEEESKEILWYLIIICSAGFLWVEPKL